MLIFGVAIGYFAASFTQNKPETTSDENSDNTLIIRAGGYQFTNPLLDCDNFHPSILKNHVELKNNLNNYVNEAIKGGTADTISVYFCSLNNGPWIGVNENYYYTPASLLKVPLLVAVLKKSEEDSDFLKTKILYDKVADPDFSPNIVDKYIQLGKTYTVEELLEYMIIHSDNNAKQILLNMLGEDYLFNVMTDLGVNLKNRDLNIDFISAREYSSFYRIMYNASYLSRSLSEKGLKILSKTEFKNGIPNKLPKNIAVAHKFGERGFLNSNKKQLHDCGIVYLPDSPYLLCIMTKGKDFNQLVQVISIFLRSFLKPFHSTSKNGCRHVRQPFNLFR